MAFTDITWSHPKYAGYSVLNAINPAICWQEPYNNPLVKEFRVQMYLEEDDKWIDYGNTTKDYVRIESDDYNIRTSYQIRIATIGVSRLQSPWSYSQRYVASPLRFDFTATPTVKIPDGQTVTNQRLLFLLF